MTLEKNQFKHLESLNSFTLPGKTFLVGEYAVLAGGSCLGLATRPSFSMNLKGSKQTFHANSPAGLYLSKNNLIHFEHEFINPYGVGGFGASTAEFIFSYFSNFEASKKLEDIFKAYISLFDDRPEQKPSGADLVTQLIGGISHIDLSGYQPKVEKLNWNFKDLDFLIYSTGLKVKTHEHLANLDRLTCESLVKPCSEVIQAFKTNDSQVFKEALASWSKNLEQLGFIVPEILQLKSRLEAEIPEILVKPCGALGADVIVVLTSKEQKQSVLAKIEQTHLPGLTFHADSSHLINGPLSI